MIEKEFATINQIVDQKIALLDQEDMLITSVNNIRLIIQHLKKLRIKHTDKKVEC